MPPIRTRPALPTTPEKAVGFCRHRSSPRRAPESHLWPIETHHGKSVLAAGHEVVDR